MAVEIEAIKVTISGELAADLRLKAAMMGLSPEALVEAILRNTNNLIHLAHPLEMVKQVERTIG